MPERDPTDPTQDPVIRFLSDPQNYGADTADVEIIETHGARVFLAGRRAIKIKRAVRYDYMDFSTLEKRRAALSREFEINHPHAPEIYQRVIPITRERDGTITFDGDGEPIEWALVMTRFDQARLLSNIASAGKLDTDLGQRIADAITAYHESASPAASAPGADRIEKTITHLATSGLTDPAIAPPGRINAWAARARQGLAANRANLDQRAAAGAVRPVHGDLHLANIVIIDGQPRLFDAIEFDDEIRTVDRLYDLAFLLMDLATKDCQGAANVIFNRYLAHPANETDLDALALLPLFLSLRAAIRAMVSSQRAHLAAPDHRDLAHREAHAYFERAEAYLIPAAPRMLAIGGFSGTGKTTLARALAPDIAPPPGAVIVRSDVERKRLFAVPETTRLPPESYTPTASEAVYANLYAKARRILATGHSVILDAVFSKADERSQAAQIAHDAAVPFSGLWLEAPPDTLRARVAARTGDASDATPNVVDAQLAARPEKMAWTRVTAADSPAATLKNARAALQHEADEAPHLRD